MAQHGELAEDRWSTFTLDQQILMIANEMNRAFRLVLSADIDRVKNCYERVLHLTDLTVRVQTKSALRWELLRWRDLIAELYVEDTTRPEEHRQAFRCLLYFTPEAAKPHPCPIARRAMSMSLSRPMASRSPSTRGRPETLPVIFGSTMSREARALD